MGSVHHYLSDSHHAYSLIPIFSSLKTTTGHKKAWFLKLSLAPVSSACYSYPWKHGQATNRLKSQTTSIALGWKRLHHTPWGALGYQQNRGKQQHVALRAQGNSDKQGSSWGRVHILGWDPVPPESTAKLPLTSIGPNSTHSYWSSSCIYNVFYVCSVSKFLCLGCIVF